MDDIALRFDQVGQELGITPLEGFGVDRQGAQQTPPVHPHAHQPRPGGGFDGAVGELGLQLLETPLNLRP